MFEAAEELRHLTQFFGTTLASPSALEAGGKVWGEAGEGKAQGMPDATAVVCVGLQPSILTLDSDCGGQG